MAEPKVRFKRDDGCSYPAWKEYSISDLFTKVGNKNKDGQNTNVITNSAEFGLIPQRDYFDKDIAVEGNTGNYTIIQTGDFVYNPRKSLYAPMGPFNCYRLEEDGIVSPLYSCLRPKGVLNPEYLLWYFQTDKWYGYVNDHGAQNGARHDRVGMTDKILMGIPVTAPCEEEQQKIADFLSSVDEVITASEEEVANLETQKKTVMKKIFSQEVRFKRADGTDFPEWKTRNMSDQFFIKSRVGWQALSREEYLSSGDYYLVTGTDIADNNIVDYKRCWYVSKERYDMDTNIQIKNGDIIITKDGTIGKVAQIKELDKPATLNSHLFLVRDESNETLNTYLLYVFLSPVFTDFVNATKTGSTLTGLPLKTFIEFKFPVPCIEEQRLIADFLSDFDEAIAAAKKELELWKELKKGLLQQMFV